MLLVGVLIKWWCSLYALDSLSRIENSEYGAVFKCKCVTDYSSLCRQSSVNRVDVLGTRRYLKCCGQRKYLSHDVTAAYDDGAPIACVAMVTCTCRSQAIHHARVPTPLHPIHRQLHFETKRQTSTLMVYCGLL